MGNVPKLIAFFALIYLLLIFLESLLILREFPVFIKIREQMMERHAP